MTTTPVILPAPHARWLAARGRTSLALAATGALGAASLLLYLPVNLLGPWIPLPAGTATDLAVLLELVFNLGILSAVFIGVPLCGLLRFHEFLLRPDGELPPRDGRQALPRWTRLVASVAAPTGPIVTLARLLLLPAVPAAALLPPIYPAALLAWAVVLTNLALLPLRIATNRASADRALIASQPGDKKDVPPDDAPGTEPPRFA